MEYIRWQRKEPENVRQHFLKIAHLVELNQKQGTLYWFRPQIPTIEKITKVTG